MDDKKTIKVRHDRIDGVERVEIYVPGRKSAYRRAKWQMDPGATSIDSAVDALFCGYEDALDYYKDFGVEQFAIYSTVPGALDAFESEMERIESGKSE